MIINWLDNPMINVNYQFPILVYIHTIPTSPEEVPKKCGKPQDVLKTPLGSVGSPWKVWETPLGSVGSPREVWEALWKASGIVGSPRHYVKVV